MNYCTVLDHKNALAVAECIACLVWPCFCVMANSNDVGGSAEQQTCVCIAAYESSIGQLNNIVLDR